MMIAKKPLSTSRSAREDRMSQSQTRTNLRPNTYSGTRSSMTWFCLLSSLRIESKQASTYTKSLLSTLTHTTARTTNSLDPFSPPAAATTTNMVSSSSILLHVLLILVVQQYTTTVRAFAPPSSTSTSTTTTTTTRQRRLLVPTTTTTFSSSSSSSSSRLYLFGAGAAKDDGSPGDYVCKVRVRESVRERVCVRRSVRMSSAAYRRRCRRRLTNFTYVLSYIHTYIGLRVRLYQRPQGVGGVGRQDVRVSAVWSAQISLPQGTQRVRGPRTTSKSEKELVLNNNNSGSI